MALIDLEECIAAYDFSPAGFDNGQLVDQKGSNNMDFVDRGVAAPVFNVRDGNDCTDLTNQFYYEGTSLLNPGFSCVITSVAGGLPFQVLYPIADAARLASPGNFAADPYENTDAQFLSNTFRQKGFFNFGSSLRFNDKVGVQTVASYTANEPTLYTGTVDVDNNALTITKNEDAPIISNLFPNEIAIFNSGNFMRFGFLNADGSLLPANSYLSMIKMYFFAGDVTKNPDFAQARLDEINSL